MDIEELIKSEAPDNSPHDIAYAIVLQSCYHTYKDLDLSTLQEYQQLARQIRNGTHYHTASCMVLQELIYEKSRLGAR
ncbi:MAG: hypothetical protein ACYSSO_10715 [Planctomycetota bacterium]|jgi:hypothetical protein